MLALVFLSVFLSWIFFVIDGDMATIMWNFNKKISEKYGRWDSLTKDEQSFFKAILILGFPFLALIWTVWCPYKLFKTFTKGCCTLNMKRKTHSFRTLQKNLNIK